MFSYLLRHIQGDFLMPLHASISKWKARLISLPAVGWLIIYGIGRHCWLSYLYGGFLSSSTYLGSHSAYGYCNHTAVYSMLHLGIPLLIFFKVVWIESNVKRIASAALLCVQSSLNNVSNFALEDKPCPGKRYYLLLPGIKKEDIIALCRVSNEKWQNCVWKKSIHGNFS